jgi:hypothetical protein
VCPRDLKPEVRVSVRVLMYGMFSQRGLVC